MRSMSGISGRVYAKQLLPDSETSRNPAFRLVARTVRRIQSFSHSAAIFFLPHFQ